MITKGQARRIAAEWQAPGNACSALQHVGKVEAGLPAEIDANLATAQAHDDRKVRIELLALKAFAEAHLRAGRTTVPGWGAWDETPVEA